MSSSNKYITILTVAFKNKIAYCKPSRFIKIRIAIMSSSSNNKLIYWFVFQNGRLLVHKTTNVKILDSISILRLQGTFTHQFLLAHFEQFDIYCAEITSDAFLPDDINAIGIQITNIAVAVDILLYIKVEFLNAFARFASSHFIHGFHLLLLS
jgi:hypothetical protein